MTPWQRDTISIEPTIATDFIAQWVALFGDGMMRDKRAAH